MDANSQNCDTNHIDKMSRDGNNRGIISEQILAMESQYFASRTESLHARAEKAIEKLQGHVSLSKSPELANLVGISAPDQTVVSTATVMEVIDVLRDSILNSSTLELDAAQDSFAAEESHLLNHRVRDLTSHLYKVIEIARSLSPVPIAEIEAIDRSLREASHSKI